MRRIVAGRLFRTPEEIDGYCKTLITKVGKDGGFTLDGAAGIPDEASPENVMATARSVQKYVN